VPLAEALPMLALDALLARRAPLLDSGAMRTWHGFARRHFGEALDALRPRVDDQAAYAAAAHAAIRAMFAAMAWDETADAEAEPAGRDGAVPLPLGLAADHAGGGGVEVEQAGRGAAPPAAAIVGARAAPYHAFTQAFDRVVDAGALLAEPERARLRAQLDASMREARARLAHLANRLQRQLQAERLSDWEFDREEGLLDAARLARVVADPTHALSFKQERLAPSRDTVVALLIDNSGSMRGWPVSLAAMAADLAAQALERSGVACEVLGFSTVGWKGGRSYKAWAAAGRPANPGRLCDLLHVVYKSAADSYRRARENFGVMLGEDLLRENVDGEALLWAASRLRARPEQRRLLLVISDGAPNDRTTLDANRDGLYLARHLREVVGAIEARGTIELSAIGIRHDVGAVYRRATTVDDAAALGPALLAQLGRSLRSR
jgi:cobaltochelatase CobT